MKELSPQHSNGEAGPAVAEAAASPAADTASTRRKPADTWKLPPEREQLAAELLNEGDTFEDVVEAINATAGPKVSQRAVEHFFRTHSDVQRRRVEGMVKRADDLKASLYANPDSAEAKLAGAALLTGLMRLSRGGAELTVKDAMSLRLQRENLRLRQRVLRMKDRDAVLKHALTQAQAHHEFERLKLTREKVRLLRRNLKCLRRGQQLGPETFQKIQEIYGILGESYTPPEHQAENPEPPAA
jgi:hypothetical protein